MNWRVMLYYQLELRLSTAEIMLSKKTLHHRHQLWFPTATWYQTAYLMQITVAVLFFGLAEFWDLKKTSHSILSSYHGQTNTPTYLEFWQ